MKLLTSLLIQTLNKHPLYSTEKQDTAGVLVKFFTPDSSWTWYVLEGSPVTNDNPYVDDPDWEFFGLVEGHEKELGYVTLSELQSARGPLGLAVERDKHFAPHYIDKGTNEVIRSETINVVF